MPTQFTTLPGMLRHVSQTFQNPKALFYKKDGNWTGFSTQQFLEVVQKIGTGLIEIGLKPGDRVGIVADPSPFWMMFDFAVLGAGGITVPMFSNISRENLQFEIQDSGMRFLFVGSEAQFQALSPFFKSLERIIAYPKSLESEQCLSWESLQNLGEKRLVANKDEWDTRSRAVKDSDTATLIYTSGSTGVPKGVELTHRNLVSQVSGATARFPMDPNVDSALSCLPLAHVFERLVTYFYVSTGMSLYFADDIKKVGENLREVHPTIITMVPRLLEKVYAKFQANVETATGFKKALGLAALKRAREKNHIEPATWKDKIFDILVYQKMRIALGGKLRLIISGSAPLDPSLSSFFLNIGLPVFEGYGLTEASPVLAVNFPSHRKVGTVGPLFPSVEVRIGDDGEILASGPNIMKGYYNKPIETKEVLENGWLRTGDLGHIDNEGFLKITGRKKELFKTANGKYVAPVPIEQAISKNKLVEMSMIIAEGRPFTTALLFPDLENLKALKHELGCESMDDLEFLSSKEAKTHIQSSLDQVNEGLNHWEKVQKFYLAPRVLTIDSGELTPTLKIRRHIVEEKFRKEIDSFYTG